MVDEPRRGLFLLKRNVGERARDPRSASWVPTLYLSVSRYIALWLETSRFKVNKLIKLLGLMAVFSTSLRNYHYTMKTRGYSRIAADTSCIAIERCLASLLQQTEHARPPKVIDVSRNRKQADKRVGIKNAMFDQRWTLSNGCHSVEKTGGR